MPVIIAGFWLAWIALSLVLVAWFLLTPKTPEQLRRAEMTSGLLAAGLGSALLLVLVFAPLPYGTATATAQETGSGSASPTAMRIVFQSLWEAGIGPRLAVYLLLVSLLVGWAALLAFLHAHRRNPATLALLWGVVGLLVLAVLLGIFSIGPVFFPVAALAFAAAFNGSRRQPGIQSGTTS